MEVQLIIDGSFEEIQEVFRLLSGGYKQATLEEIRVPGCTIEEIKPNIRPEEITATASSEIVSLDKELGEPASEYLQIHCHFCGHLFHPIRKKQKHCSSLCYQREWYELHKKTAKSPTANVAEPAAELAPVKELKPGRATVKGGKSKFKKEKKPLVKDDFGGLY